MMKTNKSISDGCLDWRDRIPGLTGLKEDDPEFAGWVEHAGKCAECAVVLDLELALRNRLADLKDPGPAFIANRVMSRIRRGKGQAKLLRRGEAALGLAGSVAGVILGIWLAGSLPNGSGMQVVMPEDVSTSWYADDIDETIWKMLTETNGDTP